MTQSELDLIHQYLNGTLSEDAMQQLQPLLREKPEARRLLRDLSTIDTKLQDLAAANPETLRLLAAPILRQTQHEPNASRLTLHNWRPLAAAAAGLVFGLLSASMLWAYAVPRAVTTVEQLFSLVDGSFEKQPGRIPSGFPVALGTWSGDDAEIVADGSTEAGDGHQLLRFKEVGREANTPEKPAKLCDVYQLIDLRPLRAQMLAKGESVLELSAEFLDARKESGDPVRFMCLMYLFEGDPLMMHQSWPLSLNEAVGSGASKFISQGGGSNHWKTVTASCVLPVHADFAVVQIGAGFLTPAGIPTPTLGAQFADHVTLTLRTQPALPVRVVQR